MGRPRPPPSPPSPANPSRPRLPSTAKSSPRPRLGWVMLDRFVHRTKGGEVGEADGTLSEVSDTCNGEPIRVSIRVADPPASSCLYLHWPAGDIPDLSRSGVEPSILAAHRHSILFRAHVPLVSEFCVVDPSYYPIDYFVYTAYRSDRSPSLRRLPPCFIGGQVDPWKDQFFKPYRRQQQRLMRPSGIGLLCPQGIEFTVAALNVDGELCVLNYVPGKDMKWRIKKLQMPHGKDTPDILCGSWQTDTVIPFGDCYLCWVDYFRGLLFVDVLAEHSKAPHYVPMPKDLHSRRLYYEECIDSARHVCVTDTGMIKLICVHDDAGRSVHPLSCSKFTITIWNLTNFKVMQWDKHATMEASEFWPALDINKSLPHVLPEFPTMNLDNPDVICFRLNCDHLFWLIEVNMKKKVLGAITLYIHEENEECAADMASRDFSCEHSFIPSQFTRYLNDHAIGVRSLKFSKELHNTKLMRAMERGWIEGPIEELILTD